MRSAWTCALAVLTVSGVVACASTDTPGVASVQPQPVATAASDAKPNARQVLPKGYRVVNEGGRQLYCRREVLTGSRTRAIETCLTQAQLDAERNETEDYLRRIQSTPVDTSSQSDSSGGRSVGPMSQ